MWRLICQVAFISSLEKTIQMRRINGVRSVWAFIRTGSRLTTEPAWLHIVKERIHPCIGTVLNASLWTIQLRNRTKFVDTALFMLTKERSLPWLSRQVREKSIAAKALVLPCFTLRLCGEKNSVLKGAMWIPLDGEKISLSLRVFSRRAASASGIRISDKYPGCWKPAYGFLFYLSVKRVPFLCTFSGFVPF